MKMKLVLILVGFLRISAGAGEQSNAEQSNYVVIGAFASEKNAIQFTKTAKRQNLNPLFEINQGRHLYYVYVLHTGNKQTAVEEAIKLRKETSFWDTWVFSGVLGDHVMQQSGTDIHPETGEKMVVTAADMHATVGVQTDSPVVNATMPPAEERLSESADEKKTENGRRFLFKIFRAGTTDVVAGDIDVINLENQKKVSSFKGNENVLVQPVNKTGNVTLECEVFGYRKIKQLVNANNPEASEVVAMQNGLAVVPFELVRLQKGDVAIMYNVFFYKDAAIMRPESKYEVTSLVQMMKENPNYEIKIHGHTNGSASGKIIEMGDSKNFFSLADTREGFGSAKKLSEERALLIQEFLKSEGIDPKRMQIKAWGGKKPVYEKNHSQAHANVRVEIEILRN